MGTAPTYFRGPHARSKFGSLAKLFPHGRTGNLKGSLPQLGQRKRRRGGSRRGAGDADFEGIQPMADRELGEVRERWLALSTETS